MKKITEKMLCFFMILPLVFTFSYTSLALNVDFGITVFADEDEDSADENAEATDEDTPTEADDEPDEENTEATDGDDEPEETDSDSEPDNEQSEDDDESIETDNEDSNNDTEEDDDESSSPDNASGSTKATARTKSTSDTTTLTSMSGTASKSAASTAAANSLQETSAKISIGKTAFMLAAILIVALTIFIAVRIRILNGQKMVYYPEFETDSTNCPVGALDFNLRYGKYGACALTEYENRIILTFEPDYETKYTSQILDVLKAKKVSAVFFLTGSCAETHDELIRRMINEGHILGNYGMSNMSMPDMSTASMREEIMGLHDLILQEYGYEMKYMRPPCGEFSKKLLALAQNFGYTTLMWSFSYDDLEEYDLSDRKAVLEGIISSAHSGGVYILSAASENDAAILEDTIDILRDKGFVF